jgi:hypothetical protein
VLGFFIGLGAIGALVVYPRVGASVVRDKLAAKVRAKLGRELKIGQVEVGYGRAVIRGLDIVGPADGAAPLVHIDRIDVAFAAMPALYGDVRLGLVTVDGVTVAIRRGADGVDNVRDALERLRAPSAGAGGGGGSRPTAVIAKRLRVTVDDDVTGIHAAIDDGDARWAPTAVSASLRGLTAKLGAGPHAEAEAVTITREGTAPPVVEVAGGQIALWPRLALTGIAGTVAPAADAVSRYTVDLGGGYGGVDGRLWTARGPLDVAALTAEIDLEVAKFQLDRLAPILDKSPVLDYQATSVDAALHLAIDRGGARFGGGFHLHDLNVGHPMLADREVRELDISGEVTGGFDRAARRLELSRGAFITRGVPFELTGHVTLAGGIEDGVRKEARVVAGHFVIPPVPCQQALDAIPAEMAPYLVGYRLKGTFDVDLHLGVDWADLDATDLGGHVGIRNCKVIDAPKDSPKRLKEPFEQAVEAEKGEWTTFVVGPDNPDFVPFEDISPFVVKSIMSTEDSAFMTHHGFIPSEFRTALVSNLKAGAFKYGASSITMQLVKNVLLFREKTLARKLQELFLTWDVENTLTKERILEIYLNVIEYGPGLYGIGPAAQQYFGKPAKDLNPVEAAFFSSILPSPKERYKQYCEGTLTKWTADKIQRILAIMYKRDRLTEAEFTQAQATPLLFVKDGSETEEDCLKRVKKAIKNSRPTNPLRKDEDADQAQPKAKAKANAKAKAKDVDPATAPTTAPTTDSSRPHHKHRHKDQDTDKAKAKDVTAP